MIPSLSNPTPLAPALPLEAATQQPATPTQAQKNRDALFRSLPRLGGVATSIFVGLGGLVRRFGLVGQVGLVRPMVLGTIVGGTIEFGLLMLERQRENSVYANHSWLDLAKLAFWDDAFSATLNLAIGRTVGLGLGNVHSIVRGILVNLAIGEVQALKNLDTTHGNEDRLIAMISGALGGAWAPWLQHRAKTELGFEIAREFGESLAQIKFDQQAPGKLTTDVMIESLVMSFSEVGGSLAGHRGGIRVQTPQPATTITQFQPQFAGSVETSVSERGPVVTSSQLDPPLAKFVANFRAQYRLQKIFADKSDTDPRHVLFVCTGNTHRSAAMHLTLEQLAEDLKPPRPFKSPKITVSSAGLHAIPQATIDPVVAALAENYGIEKQRLDRFKPSNLTDESVTDADIIICASESHRRHLTQSHPEAQDKLFLFNELAPNAFWDDDLSVPDPVGSTPDTLAMFEGIQIGMRDDIWPLIEPQNDKRLNDAQKAAPQIRKELPKDWTDAEKDTFVFLVKEKSKAPQMPQMYSSIVKLLHKKFTARQVTDFCVLMSKPLNLLLRRGVTDYGLKGRMEHEFKALSNDLTPEQFTEIMLAAFEAHPVTNTIPYHQLPSEWPQQMRYQIALFCVQRRHRSSSSELEDNIAKELLTHLDTLMEQPHWNSTERAMLLNFFQKTVEQEAGFAHYLYKIFINRGRYHAAVLLVRDLGLSPQTQIDNPDAILDNLIDAGCWLRAAHLVELQELSGANVDAEQVTSIQKKAELQQKQLNKKFHRRPIPTPIKVTEEIVCFYAMQALKKRLDQIKIFRLDPQTQAQVDQLEAQLAWRQQAMVRWLQDYLVYAVLSESKMTGKYLYQQGLVTDEETFLAQAPDSDIRLLLERAYDDFIKRPWGNEYGGAPWAIIALQARALWQTKDFNAALIDRIFNLEHHNNTVFDKWRDKVDYTKTQTALDVKRYAHGLTALQAAAPSLGVSQSVIRSIGSWQARLEQIEQSVDQTIDRNLGFVPVELPGQLTSAVGNVQWMSGRAQFNPEAVKAGDILIVKTIEPDMYPAIEKAAGVIATKGNILSHAAILNREAGIPAVILPQTSIHAEGLQLHLPSKPDEIDNSRDIISGDTIYIHAQEGVAIVHNADAPPVGDVLDPLVDHSLSDRDLTVISLQDVLYKSQPLEDSRDHLDTLYGEPRENMRIEATRLLQTNLEALDRLLNHPDLSDAYVVRRSREIIAGIKRLQPYTGSTTDILDGRDSLVALRAARLKQAPTSPPTTRPALPIPDIPSLFEIDLGHASQVGSKMATLGHLKREKDRKPISTERLKGFSTGSIQNYIDDPSTQKALRKDQQEQEAFTKMEFFIPKAMGLTVNFFERYLDAAGMRAEFDRLNQELTQGLEGHDETTITTSSQAIQDLILAHPLDDQTQLADEIKGRLDEYGFSSSHLAIRSSAVCEDLATASHAGMALTKLNVPNFQWLSAVTEVWASFWSEPGVRYRHRHGIPPDQVQPAVIMQSMIPADVSGVVFTRNPTNSRNEVVIAAGSGVGRAVGSESVETITVSPQDNITANEDTDSTLTEDQSLQLAQLARAVRTKLGYEVDMEFAIAADRIYLLQARPITTLGF